MLHRSLCFNILHIPPLPLTPSAFIPPLTLLGQLSFVLTLPSILSSGHQGVSCKMARTMLTIEREEFNLSGADL